jgi:ABC-type transport system involved in multi-copper enzyme maturation permease subunit
MRENVTMPGLQTRTEYTSNRSKLQSNHLLTVLLWELRRQSMMRFSRMMIVGIALLFGVITWAQLFASQPRISHLPLYDEVITIEVLFWIFLMFVPLIMSDLVTRDYYQRTHELLMATAIPSQSYIWGRYLAGLCICLVILLPGLFVQLASCWLWIGRDVAPNAGAVLGLWLLIVLPTMLVISALFFSLSTLLPQLPGGFKLVALIVWTVICIIALVWLTSDARFSQLQWELAHNLPNLSSWLWPRAICLLVGLGSIALTARFFTRFSNVFK